VKYLLIAISVASWLAGCASHIAPYKPKHRHFELGKYGDRSNANNGSLYAEGATGLFEDPVATRIGDILVIKIDEKDLASHQADTTLKKTDATSYGLPAAFGVIAALQKKYPSIDPATLFSSTSNVNFTGNGAVQRQGQVTATLPVHVVELTPSGDLVVEGTKVIMTGDEEHHIYMSGIVRRIDIADDDTVPSSRVADAEVEYTGAGDISDTQRRGWLNRLLTKIWPF
jgi:flagellar L-ring protein precursor FlgH